MNEISKINSEGERERETKEIDIVDHCLLSLSLSRGSIIRKEFSFALIVAVNGKCQREKKRRIELAFLLML